MSPDDGIVSLLESKGFDSSAAFRLVRHAGGETPRHAGVLDIYRRGLIDVYQAFQVRPVFHGLDAIVSFVGAEGTSALFLGVYEVVGTETGEWGRSQPGCPREAWTDGDYFYRLRKARGFEELEGLVTIEWGPGARSWVQRPKYKQVLKAPV